LSEAELNQPSNKSVQGRIYNSRQWWLGNLNLSSLVVDVLEAGYCIPFESKQPSVFLKNNASALAHSDFVCQAIEELLAQSCIQEVFSIPYCCNPLSVVKGKKLRLVLDLSRSVNTNLVQFKFNYEALPTLADMFKEEFWFFSFDLQSGYHHIDIQDSYWKFLGFSWFFPITGARYFVFKVLPFGLASACFVFTKMLRPFVSRWRGMGLSAIMYIDDGICGCRTEVEALSASVQQQNDLSNAGWKVNDKKSDWKPRQIGEWLGLVIDTIRMQFVVSERKVSKLRGILDDNLFDFPHIHVRKLAKLAGFLNSLSLALGPISRLFSRQMYLCIHSRKHWNDVVFAPAGLLDELRFLVTEH
jgi:hypothetical protein